MMKYSYDLISPQIQGKEGLRKIILLFINTDLFLTKNLNSIYYHIYFED